MLNRRYTHIEKHSLFGWSTFILSCSFLIFEFTLRITPSLLVNTLLHTFHTTATQIGLLNAITGYGYVIMQIPVALLVSRRFLRSLFFFMFLLCVIGSFGFSLSPSLWTIDLSRAIIGISSAFAWVGLLKIGELYLPQRTFPVIAALLGSFAMLGASCGSLLLSYFFSIFPWRYVMLVYSGLGLVCVIILGIFNLIHHKRTNIIKAEFELKELWILFVDILKNWRSYIIFLVSFFSSIPILAFSLLWAIPFFSALYHMSSYHATLLNLSLLLGCVIGSPIIGLITSYFNFLKSTIITGYIIVSILFTLVIYLKLPIWLSAIFLFICGFTASSQMQLFTFAKRYYLEKTVILMLTLVNIGLTIGGAVFQPLLGKLLDDHHMKIHHALDYTYSVSDYRHAMIVVPIACLATIILSIFLPYRNKKNHE